MSGLYNYQWQKARVTFLRDEPLCRACANKGRTTQATIVDHIKPHKDDIRLFWDVTNWQPLCKPCHDTKTAQEDGGFGNKGRKKHPIGIDGIPTDPDHPWGGRV